ncbi:MAG: glycosyltransferase [Planctomycetia bacterium]
MRDREPQQAPLDMSAHSSPGVDLSVVFAVRGGFANNRKTIECLLGQTIASRMELVVISDSQRLLREIEEFVAAAGRLARCEFLLHAGDHLTGDRLRAATKATAGVLAFAEDHAFHDRNWAEEITAAFASSEDIHAAAPRLVNPNPESAVSRAQFLLNHGSNVRHIEPRRFGDCEHLPWHATAYRRDVFAAEAGGGHVERVQAEVFLQEHIRKARPAARFVRCDRTVTQHVNMSRIWPALLLAFHGGRIFGAVRTTERGWGLSSRIARALLFPVVAALKIRRTASLLWDRSSWLRTGSNFAVAGVLACVHALGEAVGSCSGAGDSERVYSEVESNRVRFLRPAERHHLFSNGCVPQAASHPHGSRVEQVS